MKVKHVSDLNKYLNYIPETVSEKHVHVHSQDNDKIFHLKNGDLGVAYKFNGLYDEPLNQAELDGFLNVINSSLSHMFSKGNYVIQFHMKQRAVTDFKLDKSNAESSPIVDSILENELAYLNKSKMIYREFLISIRFECGERADLMATLIRGILNKSTLNSIDKNKQHFESDLSSFEGQIYNFFKMQRIESAKYISLCQSFLGGGSDVFCDETDINKRIISPPISESEDGVLNVGNVKTAIFYLNLFPSNYSSGKFRHFIDSLPYRNIDIVLTLSNGTSEYRHAFNESFFNGSHPLGERLKLYRSELSRDNPEALSTLRLIIHDFNNEQEGEVVGLGKYHLSGLLKKEKTIAFHSLITSLPLNCNSESNALKGKHKTMLLERALWFAPIFNGPEYSDGVLPRISRYGIPTRFNQFKGEGNRIKAVLGLSRAGKSSASNLSILEFSKLYPKSIIRVIDKKTSYQKICDLLGGKVVRFSESDLRNQLYSPFNLGSVYDDDDVEFVFLLIKSVISMKNKSVTFTSLHDEILRDAIKQSYNNNKLSFSQNPTSTPPHPIWTDVLACLPTSSLVFDQAGANGAKEASDDIYNWSVNLGETGQFGFLFNRHEPRDDSNIDEDKMIVYDLDGIQDETLKYIATSMSFIKTSRDFKKLEKTMVKLFNIDEFGVFCLEDGDAQKIAKEQMRIIFKTCAKLNVCMATITNDASDYINNEVGKTVWGQATIKEFLPLGDIVTQAKESWGGSFTDGEWQILSSLEKEPSKRRSSCYIVSRNEDSPYKGSFYIPLSPMMDIITSSSPSVVSEYSNRMEKYSEIQCRKERAWKVVQELALESVSR